LEVKSREGKEIEGEEKRDGKRNELNIKIQPQAPDSAVAG
jgi:hypothetical protein